MKATPCRPMERSLGQVPSPPLPSPMLRFPSPHSLWGAGQRTKVTLLPILSNWAYYYTAQSASLMLCKVNRRPISAPRSFQSRSWHGKTAEERTGRRKWGRLCIHFSLVAHLGWFQLCPKPHGKGAQQNRNWMEQETWLKKRSYIGHKHIYTTILPVKHRMSDNYQLQWHRNDR